MQHDMTAMQLFCKNIKADVLQLHANTLSQKFARAYNGANDTKIVHVQLYGKKAWAQADSLC